MDKADAEGSRRFTIADVYGCMSEVNIRFMIADVYGYMPGGSRWF